jgi:hypothetical protein
MYCIPLLHRQIRADRARMPAQAYAISQEGFLLTRLTNKTSVLNHSYLPILPYH